METLYCKILQLMFIFGCIAVIFTATEEETDGRNDESKEDLRIPAESEDQFEDDVRTEMELNDKESDEAESQMDDGNNEGKSDPLFWGRRRRRIDWRRQFVGYYSRGYWQRVFRRRKSTQRRRRSAPTPRRRRLPAQRRRYIRRRYRRGFLLRNRL